MPNIARACERATAVCAFGVAVTIVVHTTVDDVGTVLGPAQPRHGGVSKRAVVADSSPAPRTGSTQCTVTTGWTIVPPVT
eukprot:1756996-Rhodomonas_salina.2